MVSQIDSYPPSVYRFPKAKVPTSAKVKDCERCTNNKRAVPISLKGKTPSEVDTRGLSISLTRSTVVWALLDSRFIPVPPHLHLQVALLSSRVRECKAEVVIHRPPGYESSAMVGVLDYDTFERVPLLARPNCSSTGRLGRNLHS